MNTFESEIYVVKNKSVLCCWEDQSECYSWTQPRILLSGITKRLKERFYKRAPKAPRLKQVKSAKKSDGTFWKKGKRGGTLVHEQLENFVENAKGGLEIKNLDPRVRKIIMETISRGWIIIDSEYCVGDKDLRLGTGIDLLCARRDGGMIVIEIKTGFDNVQYSGPMKMRMKKPFNMMDVSPWSQHQLQLLTTVCLFEKMTSLKVSLAEVWVVGTPNSQGETVLKSWPLHPDIMSLGDKMLTLLSIVPSKKKNKYVLKSKTVKKEGKATKRPRDDAAKKKKVPKVRKTEKL